VNELDVRSRVLLSRLSEPVDVHLNRRINEIGATETAAELVAGTSPLRNAESLRIRLDRTDPERMVDADLASAERVGARVITQGRLRGRRNLINLVNVHRYSCGCSAPVICDYWLCGQ